MQQRYVVHCIVCGLQTTPLNSRKYADELAKWHKIVNPTHECRIDDGREPVAAK